VNGEELKVENGLPLGLSAESIYPASTIQLQADAQLTVVTDGVVEARSKTGELFGFARTQGISRRPADEIARAAQSFGQEDDITVLTLACAEASVTA
jgi:serine phosphatase RsbU (regulator of sigma subunit)